jgi:acetoin utilization deacetylase AcuC-like enzyme
MTSTAVLCDRQVKRHQSPEGHPERAERFDAVANALEKTGFLKSSLHLKSRLATEDELTLVHTMPYVELLRKEVEAGHAQLSTGDAYLHRNSFDVAAHVVGGIFNTVDAVMSKKANRGFCAVRPPGHHATANRGMGFCLFNNVALAARYAQKKHGAQRVAIFDWDVHHGNGTQDIFYTDGTVMFGSVHQHPWYPGTGLHSERGENKGHGRIHNYPLPAGSGGKEILGALQQHFLPELERFQPDLVLISAGFDSREGDPLGRFRLTDSDFTTMTEMLRHVAEKTAQGRLISLLEGGYSLPGLAAGVEAHVRVLL